MVDELLPQSLFAEAENMDTPEARLVELMRYVPLQPLIAANPATPPAVLTNLSVDSEQAIRRAVAQNPNTPTRVLLSLAGEFPQEFLHNPLIPILNMTQPAFIKDLPLMSWASLFRFASLPPAWLKQVKEDRAYQRRQPAIWELMQLHVFLVDKAVRETRSVTGNVRQTYQQKLPPIVALAPEDDVELFLLFVQLFPYTAPMLKAEWASAVRVAPRRVGVALSMCKDVGGKTMSLLMRQKNLFVLSNVARHPVTSPKLLRWLASYRPTDMESEVQALQRAVASNPHTPPSVVYRLVSDVDASVRCVALTHPALEALDHEILALDQERSVRAALAALPRLAPNLFAQLATDPEPVVRAALARHLNVPLELLRTLASDSESVVRVAAAGNPRLPVESQAALLVDPIESVRASLSGNARLSVDHATQLARAVSPSVRGRLAANPRTPVELLDILWQTGGVEVWQGLARHPKSSPELLTQLAHQDDRRTRIAVAAHKRTPEEILAELAREDVHEIWCALASNPHTPLSILEQAVSTASLDLCFRLFNHPALVRARRRPFLKLLRDKMQPLIAANRLPNWLRRVFLQYYTALPLEIVALFAESPYWEERYLVARRSHMPEEVLTVLAQDGICYVQDAAREALTRIK